ncbi:MAG: diguanylate cyclase [Burkholderiaceae bacterium]|nr:diguanylate cyclase [Burkholderiaceae bacterium]MDH3460960.1 diguanylate cyclase [Burkholderiaceae bacterium]
MSDTALRVLLVDGAQVHAPVAARALERTRYGTFTANVCPGLAQATEMLAGRRYDAVVFFLDGQDAEHLLMSPALSLALLDAAVIAVLPACGTELALRLVQIGVQDVLDAPGSQADAQTQLARCLRLAIERRRIEHEVRTAYATDLHTGLPNRQQLIEHMSLLIALRGREPAPMALLVLRIEGFDTTEAKLGRESANVLRRKVAVRLRSAVRSSDVVAALGSSAFALLLASTEGPLDANHVAKKLLTALHDPYVVAGQEVGVAASIGVAVYPDDGADVGLLMRKAAGAAAATHTSGRSGFSNWLESMGEDMGAANDGAMPEK